MSKKPKSEALRELYDRVIGDDQKAQAEYEDGIVSITAGQLIYDMRTAAGFSQRELEAGRDHRQRDLSAGKCGLQRSTLAMLNRIASVLGRRIELHAVPKEAA